MRSAEAAVTTASSTSASSQSYFPHPLTAVDSKSVPSKTPAHKSPSQCLFSRELTYDQKQVTVAYYQSKSECGQIFKNHLTIPSTLVKQE